MVSRNTPETIDVAESDFAPAPEALTHPVLKPMFYSEEEAALLLGIHRTTLRTLAVHGRAPVPPVQITEHKRIYRRIDVERLAGLAP